MRAFSLWLLVLALVGLALSLGTTNGRAEGPNAVLSLAGCTTNTLLDNDDSSTGIVPIGFQVNFFGTPYDSLYVNNNGNVTFLGPLSEYVPFSLTTATAPMIAAFLTDIDTRGRPEGALPVTYGAAVYNGRPAFCVNWVHVGEFSHNYTNLVSAQLLLVNQGAGNFDIIFNYDGIGFDHGAAGIGYTNGSGDPNTFYEFPGTLQRGAFLDSSPTGLVHSSQNSSQLGRYLFQVRGGALPVGGAIQGTVTLAAGGAPVGGAPIQVCPGAGGRCRLSVTNALGGYNVSGLAPSSWIVTATAPAASALLPSVSAPTLLTATGATTVNLTMTGPTPPPPGTSITNIGMSGGVPTVYWNDPLTLTTTGCAGATVTFSIVVGGTVVRTGTMTEGPAGSYTGHTTSLYPAHGAGQVSFHIVCPDATVTNPGFNIYIDPSGTVQDTHGDPIAGATVTLSRADTNSGPFDIVPDGSALMSPTNRTNPDTTDADGHFGWDVVAGFYVVRATAPGCHDPADAAVAFVETDVLDIPPPVTDLELVLDCDVAPPPPPPGGGGSGGSSGGDGGGSAPAGEELSADVGISGSGPASLRIGESGTVTVVAANHGPGHAANVEISLAVPDGLALDSATTELGSCTVAASGASCTVGTLGTGASTTITLRVHATSRGAKTISAGISSLQADPNVGGNNRSSVTVNVMGAPQLTGPGNGAAAPPLRIARLGVTATLATSFTLDSAATVRVAVLDGRRRAVQLLAGSSLGATTGSGFVLSGSATPGALGLRLKMRPAQIKKGVQYTLVVIAANDGGTTQVEVRFRG